MATTCLPAEPEPDPAAGGKGRPPGGGKPPAPPIFPDDKGDGDQQGYSDSANADTGAVGTSRVARVFSYFGRDVVDEGRIVTTPYGKTDIDVVLRDKTFIEVGGPAKAQNLAKFGQQLQRVAWAANNVGGRAMFMYDSGTPQSAIDLAIKWFGAGGARPIP